MNNLTYRDRPMLLVLDPSRFMPLDIMGLPLEAPTIAADQRVVCRLEYSDRTVSLIECADFEEMQRVYMKSAVLHDVVLITWHTASAADCAEEIFQRNRCNSRQPSPLDSFDIDY